MAASFLDGKKVAGIIRSKIRSKIQMHTTAGYTPPGLAVILLGNDPASKIYVNNKRKACEEVGIHSYAYDLPETTTEQEVLALIDDLNQNTAIHGILVQLPLPAHIKTAHVIERIKPTKDVDGFHPYNLGRLAQRTPLLRPCTPYGIIQLLNYYQLSIPGKHGVVVGASNIVGRPMALELLLAKATATVCHRFTPNLEPYIRSADIIVIATGKIDLINPQWLHEEQIVIDVGIHRLEDGTIRGDLDFALAQTKVAWITPVPGGVGPMTICALLQNTFQAAHGSFK